MIAYILNLFDLGCTLAGLRLGARELNPLMRCVPFQIFYKVVAIGILCWWLHRRPEPLAKRGLQLCTLFYGILAVYHLYGLITI